jgi:hypothetical protein
MNRHHSLKDANVPNSASLKALAPAPALSLGLARLSRPLGVPPEYRDRPSEPVDKRREVPEELRALFHCLTSSTASLKFAGGFETGASVRRHPTIQACLSNLRADTLRLGSFWKHCMRKSRAAYLCKSVFHQILMGLPFRQSRLLFSIRTADMPSGSGG